MLIPICAQLHSPHMWIVLPYSLYAYGDSPYAYGDQFVMCQWNISDLLLSHAFNHFFFACKCSCIHIKKTSPLTIATTRRATKSTMKAMTRWDTTTVTMATNVDVNDDDTAVCLTRTSYKALHKLCPYRNIYLKSDNLKYYFRNYHHRSTLFAWFNTHYANWGFLSKLNTTSQCMTPLRPSLNFSDLVSPIPCAPA